MDVGRDVPAILRADPGIRDVRLVGSRAKGRAHERSDWDFAVDADDFDRVARELPGLVASLHPLSALWDPYSEYECYMLLLPGPTKVDLFFPQRPREWAPPYDASPGTLASIDRHFWDWILWLDQKERGGRSEVLEKGLGDLHRLLLAPMGVADPPDSTTCAVESYLAARSALELRFGVQVPRAVEKLVRPVLGRRPAVDFTSDCHNPGG